MDKISGSGYRVIKSVYIQHDLAEQIRDKAKKEGTSFNRVAERALIREAREAEVTVIGESKEIKGE